MRINEIGEMDNFQLFSHEYERVSAQGAGIKNHKQEITDLGKHLFTKLQTSELFMFKVA